MACTHIALVLLLTACASSPDNTLLDEDLLHVFQLGRDDIDNNSYLGDDDSARIMFAAADGPAAQLPPGDLYRSAACAMDKALGAFEAAADLHSAADGASGIVAGAAAGMLHDATDVALDMASCCPSALGAAQRTKCAAALSPAYDGLRHAIRDAERGADAGVCRG